MQFLLTTFMTERRRKSIFMERMQDIKLMLCGLVTRYVSPFMEMKQSKKKLGHHLYRV